MACQADRATPIIVTMIATVTTSSAIFRRARMSSTRSPCRAARRDAGQSQHPSLRPARYARPCRRHVDRRSDSSEMAASRSGCRGPGRPRIGAVSARPCFAAAAEKGTTTRRLYRWRAGGGHGTPENGPGTGPLRRGTFVQRLAIWQSFWYGACKRPLPPAGLRSRSSAG
jgi:hypothetical protein